MAFDSLKPQVSTILSDKNQSVLRRLEEVCSLLQSSIDYYDWVGFYFANHESKTLHLEAFSGTPTDHVTIPFGKGICGQVAVSNENFVVPNVQDQQNYISCGIDVKSEVVIPLFKEDINVGQIDIDSHVLDPFSEDDVVFLTWVNREVSKILVLNSDKKVVFN